MSARLFLNIIRLLAIAIAINMIASCSKEETRINFSDVRVAINNNEMLFYKDNYTHYAIALPAIQIEADASLPSKTALLFGKGERRGDISIYFDSATIRVSPEDLEAWQAALKNAQKEVEKYEASLVAPRTVLPPKIE